MSKSFLHSKQLPVKFGRNESEIINAYNQRNSLESIHSALILRPHIAVKQTELLRKLISNLARHKSGHNKKPR
jgi:hypothetical protein